MFVGWGWEWLPLQRVDTSPKCHPICVSMERQPMQEESHPQMAPSHREAHILLLQFISSRPHGPGLRGHGLCVMGEHFPQGHAKLVDAGVCRCTRRRVCLQVSDLYLVSHRTQVPTTGHHIPLFALRRPCRHTEYLVTLVSHWTERLGAQESLLGSSRFDGHSSSTDSALVRGTALTVTMKVSTTKTNRNQTSSLENAELYVFH